MLKNIIKSIGNEFIYGSHMLALDAVAMVLSIFIITGHPIDLLLLIISYLVTQIIYSYNHIKEADFDSESNPERAALFKKSKTTKKYIFAIYTFSLVILLLQTNILVVALVLFIVAGGVLYTDYFKKLKIVGFKNFYVSIFWVLISLIVPLKYGEAIGGFYLSLLAIYFLTAFASTIFFDLKDVESDGAGGIKTFPVKLGIPKTLYLLYFIKILSLIIVILLVFVDILPRIFLWYIVAIIYGLVYINRGSQAKDKKLRLVSYLFADAEFIFWLVILVAARNIF